MKIYFRFIGGLYLYWLAFFFFLRMLFIIIQTGFSYSITVQDLFNTFIYGCYMDLAMSAYFMIVPLFLVFIHRWIPFQKILLMYTLCIAVIISALYAGDAVLYHEWGFRLDKTAFKYLANLKEASSFVSITNAVIMTCCFLVNMATGYWFFIKMANKKPDFKTNSIYFVNFLMIPFLIIPMRGGTGIIPMNPGKVYFSSHPFPNHAALNVSWNLMFSLLQKKEQSLALHFMDERRAGQLVDSLFAGKNDSTEIVLNTSRPKMLFILLESFTAKLIGRTQENIEITPRLNNWLRRGIYFSNAYATGDRTEIGLASVLSGFPAQPQSAIIQYPNKTAKLPSLIKLLKTQNYTTSFYYGGDASFANMNTYFYNAACDVIIDKYQFPASSYNAKWGVHDHILFGRLLHDIRHDSSMFLKVCLSLSSHPPYDIPESAQWKGTDEETKFFNTAHYTDKHLGMLLDTLSELPVWKEMLIIICADHGARLPGNIAYHVPEKFKIPIWFGGGAIKENRMIDAIFSQNDIAATLLNQLGLTADEFVFSKNIFSKNYKPFAYYAFNNGFGWIEPQSTKVYSLDANTLLIETGKPSTNLEAGKAFLQNVMTEFIKL